MQKNDKLIIYGSNLEAITLAAVMAGAGISVSIIIETEELADLSFTEDSNLYLKTFWQMHVDKGKISIQDDYRIIDSGSYIWLFIDGLNSSKLQGMIQHINACSSTVVVLSGICHIGEQQHIAQDLKSEFVFYIPFVFLKDIDSFHSVLTPHLLLIGEKTQDTYQRVSFLTPLVQKAKNLCVSDIKTVEFSRNSIAVMLATRLSFINEMARLADKFKVDIHEVKRMVISDYRIGEYYLEPSWGFGGYALPKELDVLKQAFLDEGLSVSLIESVFSINEDQKELIFRKFWRYFDSYIENKRVLIWGAGYKAGSGRTQNSAIHPLLKLLWQHQVTTYIFDSNAQAELNQLYGLDKTQGLCQFVDDAYTSISRVDALFIINWSEAVAPDVYSLLHHPIPVFDAQNLLTDTQINQLTGFYAGIGRGKAYC